MAKKEVDGEGVNIPNRIKALPVKRPGPIVAAGAACTQACRGRTR